MTMKMKRARPYSTDRFGAKHDESITGEDLDEYYNVSSDESEKKMKCKRLNMEQVRVLEKSFELGKRVEPEKKLKMARDLGLHPRQVAIWFQNRRARSKTKQLERDFGVLKQDYEAFQVHHLNLKEENHKLQAEIQRLSTIFQNENPVRIVVDAKDTREINEGVCNSIQFGACTQHEGVKASMEGSSIGHKVLAKLEENSVGEEEPCYFNLGEKSHFLWDNWP